jgi:hypothetical protein
MIGIGKKDFRAQFFERALRQALNGSRRPHRHKKRRLDGPMGRRQSPAPRPSGISVRNLERKIHAAKVA